MTPDDEQPIEGEEMAGEITTPEIARQLRAEKIQHIVVLSNDIEKYAPGTFPPGVEVYDRSEIDRVRSIDFEGEETRTFVAEFFDNDGNEVSASVGIRLFCPDAPSGACGGVCRSFDTSSDCGGCGNACAAGVCTAGATAACDDGNACTADTCDGKTGACSHGAQWCR